MAAALTHIEVSAGYVRKMLPGQPDVALILGSGLGEYADTLEHPVVLRQEEIPHYPRSSVAGHRGRLVFGQAGRKSVLAFQGRLHYYESGAVETALFPVDVAAMLGIRTLVITNAAGGVNPDLQPGDLMLMTDQLNLTGERLPVAGKTWPSPCPFFDPVLLQLGEDASIEAGIRVRKGVYAGVKGPSYETAAEVAMVRTLGGDAVGMSTVLEAAEACSLGMKVLGISCITNKATGVGSERLSHEEVSEVAGRVKAKFSRLLDTIIQRL